MNPLRWRVLAMMILAALATSPAAMALPVVQPGGADVNGPETADREELPPLAEPDIESLRSWMSQSLRPVLLDDQDIDPGAWPLLEFRPLTRDLGFELELELDLPALLDRER